MKREFRSREGIFSLDPSLWHKGVKDGKIECGKKGKKIMQSQICRPCFDGASS